MGSFFNYRTYWPDDWWGRHSFVRAWWRLYAGDPRWVPPYFPALTHLVSPADPYGQRLQCQALYMEAMPRRNPDRSGASGTYAGVSFEEPVAATLAQMESQAEEAIAYLSLLHCANDEETLERLLHRVLEHFADQGCTRLIAPTGPLPTWQSGVLQDHFDRLPPLHTPYNPPYLGEVLASTMEPWLESALYALATPTILPAAPDVAVLRPLAPAELGQDLLPLLTLSLDPGGDFPPPGADGAAALLRWLEVFPLAGWVAEVDGAAVGFVLVQPDHAGLLRRARGGRLLPWRWYCHWRRHAPVKAGRLLLAAVDPAWQGRGIGRQLWRQALAHAQQAGWSTLTCGPVLIETPAAAALERWGAQRRQRYTLYTWSPW